MLDRANSDLVAAATKQADAANSSAAAFLFGFQKALLDEIGEINRETYARMRDEYRIATEFVSRMAEVHSVRGIAGVIEECGKHQADLFCRQAEHMLKHGGRVLERTSELLGKLPPKEPTTVE